jgi:hypothetical protein
LFELPAAADGAAATAGSIDAGGTLAANAGADGVGLCG